MYSVDLYTFAHPPRLAQGERSGNPSLGFNHYARQFGRAGVLVSAVDAAHPTAARADFRLIFAFVGDTIVEG
jgi:hypothetical protein